ncbi:hypothetical protein [Kordia sp.]|uniref:hypothetical protein n=1 Tax=Kordia sp. TaxID=1965332 RepID=UPI003D2B1CA4
MRFSFLFILSFLSIHFVKGQVENNKEAIVKNKVKSSVERHCFYNSSESCTTFFKSFDKRGNVTEWNMGRLGGFSKYQYNDKNQKIASFWIHKSDTSKIDTLLFTYDSLNEIIFDGRDRFKNLYDAKDRLIKHISINSNNKSDTPYTTFKSYEHDFYNNLTNEIHYENNEVVNSICYEYDSKLRLIQKKEYDTKYIVFRNKEYAEYKKPIEYFLTKITYDAKGRIKEKYDYHSDPCMSLDDHFTFKYFYKPNGLLRKATVFKKDKLKFTITYEYTFY